MNYYDYICFPNKSQRIEIKDKFFDTRKLRIDKHEYKHLTNETHKFSTKFEKINSLYQKIQHFNNNLTYLDIAMLEMCNYFNLFSLSNNECKEIYETLFRQSYRNVCCEIYIYEEKLKNLIGFILKINNKKYKKIQKNNTKKNAENNTNFIKSLRKICSKIPNGNKLITAVENYRKNKNVESIKNIRNDEVHNSIHIIEDDVNTDNSVIYEQIKKCLLSMIELKDDLISYLLNPQIFYMR